MPNPQTTKCFSPFNVWCWCPNMAHITAQNRQIISIQKFHYQAVININHCTTVHLCLTFSQFLWHHYVTEWNCTDVYILYTFIYTIHSVHSWIPTYDNIKPVICINLWWSPGRGTLMQVLSCEYDILTNFICCVEDSNAHKLCNIL